MTEYTRDRLESEIERLTAELEASGWRSPDNPPETPYEDNGRFSDRVIVLERSGIFEMHQTLVVAEAWYVAPGDGQSELWQSEGRQYRPVAWMPYPGVGELPGGGHGE